MITLTRNSLQGYKLIDGIMHSAGSLQLELFQHLKKCPNAIIHIENVAEIHAELLPVLLAVLSEQVIHLNPTYCLPNVCLANAPYPGTLLFVKRWDLWLSFVSLPCFTPSLG